MISLEDCIAFSGASHEEVAAVALCERITHMDAAALVSHLMDTADGAKLVQAMIERGRMAAQAAHNHRAAHKKAH